MVKNGEDITAGSLFNFKANMGIRLPSIFESKIEMNKVKLTNPEILVINNHHGASYIGIPISKGKRIKPVANSKNINKNANSAVSNAVNIDTFNSLRITRNRDETTTTN